jgi:hypothetical protein
VSDDDLQALPYADLWLAELGATVPEHRSDRDPRRVRPAWRLTGEGTAPDPTRDRGRA